VRLFGRSITAAGDGGASASPPSPGCSKANIVSFGSAKPSFLLVAASGGPFLSVLPSGAAVRVGTPRMAAAAVAAAAPFFKAAVLRSKRLRMSLIVGAVPESPPTVRSCLWWGVATRRR